MYDLSYSDLLSDLEDLGLLDLIELTELPHRRTVLAGDAGERITLTHLMPFHSGLLGTFLLHGFDADDVLVACFN